MNIPILLYHSVSDQATRQYRPWAISPVRFEEHIAYLQVKGYQPITVSTLCESLRDGGDSLPTLPIVITFDDGLADFASGALPVLHKYNFPATLYIATSYIGGTSLWLEREGEGDRRMLAWDEIESLEGVEVGAHSHTHPQMDIIPAARACSEMVQSKKLMEERLNRSVQSFAFPYGYHTRGLLGMVQETGFTSACVVGHEMATDACNIYSMPRIIIESQVTTAVLDRYIHGVGLQAGSSRRRILQFSWRVIRRIRARLESFGRRQSGANYGVFN